MIKSGYKSQNELRAENVLIPGYREPAPDDLEPGAKVLWEEIVTRLPADWFTSETRPLLKGYCRHANFADQFARDITTTRITIEAIEASISRGRAGIKKLPKLRELLHSLHKMHGYETEHAISCATKLRLTNQSRYEKDTAASKARNATPAKPPPWHSWNGDEHQHVAEN